MARTLAITYADLVLGAGQLATTFYPSFHLTGKYALSMTETRVDLTFEVVVQNALDAYFLAAEAALLAAYSRQDQALLVVIGGSQRHDFDPADNTGFNARASVRKVQDIASTARSARYVCGVSMELPAGQNARAGRRTSTVDVSTSPAGRRALVVSGVYTALANNAARAQFAADVDTYCSAVLSGLGGTWELVGTPTAKSDDQDKTIAFSRAFREVIYNQAQGVLDHPAISDPRLSITRAKSSSDSTRALGTVEALAELQLAWSASIKIDQTTDLEALWQDTVRPHLVAEAERVGGGAVAITREVPSFDPNENTLAVTMSVLADAGAKFLRASVDVADAIDNGTVLKPVWDGNPFSRDKYRGTGSHVRTLTRRTLRVAAGTISAGQVISDHGPPPRFNGFEFVRESRRARSWLTGLPGSEIALRSSETVCVYVRADDVKVKTREQTGGSSGGSLPATEVRNAGDEGAGEEIDTL